MHTVSPLIHSYEFCFPELDTLLRVEEGERGVVIRATRDTFSEERKRYFIRELIAEGFIAESFRWCALADAGARFGVRWVIDFSWLRLPPIVLAQARRFMMRLFLSSGLLSSALLFLLLDGHLS